MTEEPRAKLLKTNGGVVCFDRSFTIAEIQEQIGADCLDTVNLRDGRVMMVDDDGHGKDLDVNLRATAIYQKLCHRGTDWQIRGDVMIVRDEDYKSQF
jgi:hypothetical protein